MLTESQHLSVETLPPGICNAIIEFITHHTYGVKTTIMFTDPPRDVSNIQPEIRTKREIIKKSQQT